MFYLGDSYNSRGDFYTALSRLIVKINFHLANLIKLNSTLHILRTTSVQNKRKWKYENLILCSVDLCPAPLVGGTGVEWYSQFA